MEGFGGGFGAGWGGGGGSPQEGVGVGFNAGGAGAGQTASGYACTNRSGCFQTLSMTAGSMVCENDVS